MAASKLNPAIAAFGARFKKQYQLAIRAIKRYERIVVFRHIKPDFDALGTQMGLATFLKDNFPEKEIHVVGDNHVSFTPRLYPVMDDLPNEWFKGGDYLAIVVDVGDHERIADPRYRHAKYKIKFDHHPCKKEIAPRCTVCDLEAAAATEIVVNFLLHFKGTKISKEAASYFYGALVGDSGRFMFSSTSEHTFAIAGELLKSGIDIRDIYQRMYEKTLTSLNVQGYILTHYAVSTHGVAYYLLPLDVQQKYGITTELGKEHVNVFSNIAGVNAWCSITEDPNPKEPCWRISIRSKREDISPIAFKWGGGGHAQASGAKIDDLSQLEAFIKDLDDLFINEEGPYGF